MYSLFNLFQLYTDTMFMYPTVQTVRKLVAKRNDVYLYQFVYNRTKYINFWEKHFPRRHYEGNGESYNINYSSIICTIIWLLSNFCWKLWITYIPGNNFASTQEYYSIVYCSYVICYIFHILYVMLKKIKYATIAITPRSNKTL